MPGVDDYRLDDCSSEILTLIGKTVSGLGDSDRHLMSIFSVALSSKGSRYLELGVRDGTTTLPILLAAKLNGGYLYSVDIKETSFSCPTGLKEYWSMTVQDSLEYLRGLDRSEKFDFIYVDDWHSYEHVKAQLEIIDTLVGPSSVILLHDLMWGNHAPFYHCDLTIKAGQWANGGPYRAVSELDQQFWEWSTLPWNNGLTILRKKYSSRYHSI